MLDFSIYYFIGGLFLILAIVMWKFAKIKLAYDIRSQVGREFEDKIDFDQSAWNALPSTPRNVCHKMYNGRVYKHPRDLPLELYKQTWEKNLKRYDDAVGHINFPDIKERLGTYTPDEVDLINIVQTNNALANAKDVGTIPGNSSVLVWPFVLAGTMAMVALLWSLGLLLQNVWVVALDFLIGNIQVASGWRHIHHLIFWVSVPILIVAIITVIIYNSTHNILKPFQTKHLNLFIKYTDVTNRTLYEVMHGPIDDQMMIKSSPYLKNNQIDGIYVWEDPNAEDISIPLEVPVDEVRYMLRGHSYIETWTSPPMYLYAFGGIGLCGITGVAILAIGCKIGYDIFKALYEIADKLLHIF